MHLFSSVLLIDSSPSILLLVSVRLKSLWFVILVSPGALIKGSEAFFRFTLVPLHLCI